MVPDDSIPGGRPPVSFGSPMVATMIRDAVRAAVRLEMQSAQPAPRKMIVLAANPLNRTARVYAPLDDPNTGAMVLPYAMDFPPHSGDVVLVEGPVTGGTITYNLQSTRGSFLPRWAAAPLYAQGRLSGGGQIFYNGTYFMWTEAFVTDWGANGALTGDSTRDIQEVPFNDRVTIGRPSTTTTARRWYYDSSTQSNKSQIVTPFVTASTAGLTGYITTAAAYIGLVLNGPTYTSGGGDALFYDMGLAGQDSYPSDYTPWNIVSYSGSSPLRIPPQWILIFNAGNSANTLIGNGAGYPYLGNGNPVPITIPLWYDTSKWTPWGQGYSLPIMTIDRGRVQLNGLIKLTSGSSTVITIANWQSALPANQPYLNTLAPAMIELCPTMDVNGIARVDVRPEGGLTYTTPGTALPVGGWVSLNPVSWRPGNRF